MVRLAAILDAWASSRTNETSFDKRTWILNDDRQITKVYTDYAVMAIHT